MTATSVGGSLRGISLVLVAAACGGPDEPPARVDAAGEPAPEGGAPTRRFVDVTESWTLDFEHDRGATDARQLVETMGHGAALLDADEDGDLDLYLVQGGPYAGDAPRPSNRLFANVGGRFEDVTDRAGEAAERGHGMGVAVGDSNGDGHLDLHLTNFRADRLLIGDGQGSFARADAGVADPRWTTAATFFDPDADGDLDLFVVAYVAIDTDDPPWCGRREKGWRTVCHPDLFEGLSDVLWVNDGTGRFRDGTAERGVTGAGKGLGVVAFDANDDGWTDLYVANDSVENHLWQNVGGERFEDATLFSGLGVNRFGATEAGMGVTVGDLDGDLDPDLVVTNFDHESHTVYRNEGAGLFTDATPQFGLEAVTRLPVGFGVQAFDADGDRDLDLALVNGHIVERIALYDDAQTWEQAAQVFRNDGGRLTLDPGLGGDLVASVRVGRGLVAGDLDSDGDLDLVATECGGRTRVFENRGAVFPVREVRGYPPGTRVRASYVDGRTIVREVGPTGSYLCQGEGVVRLPVSVDLIRVEVRPPGEAWRVLEASSDGR